MDARLIIDEPASGTWNMAVDEALLRWAGETGGSALRFYQWFEATLSLGYFQRREDRKQHLPSSGIPLVRRSTGGGAIVHDRELTYSFVTPIRDRFRQPARQLVRRFHECLISCLSEHGVAAQLCGETSSTDQQDVFLCFQRRHELDVLIGRHKLAGSAQRRHRGALLQHGSLLLAESPSAPSLPGLTDLTEMEGDIGRLVNRWTAQLTKELQVNFAQSALCEQEEAWSTEFERTRFATEAWNGKR